MVVLRFDIPLRCAALPGAAATPASKPRFAASQHMISMLRDSDEMSCSQRTQRLPPEFSSGLRLVFRRLADFSSHASECRIFVDDEFAPQR
jgi:hypothetical protein